jgi:phosphohistidine phosphatase
MQLYLVQHGESEPEHVNPARPLTERGQAEVRSVARFAARLRVQVDEIRHSGKTRAEQTASILAQMLAPRSGVVATSGLAPNDDPKPVAVQLTAETGSIMLVGHLPFMSRLAGLLVARDPSVQVVQFRYAAIVCLVRQEAQYSLAWILTPEMAEVL